MERSYVADDNNVDDQVDHEISTCLNLERPISFFLFAGAGSGKTRSLVKALHQLPYKNHFIHEKHKKHENFQ